MIKVSVILPSLNVRKYIRECVESVVKQSLKDIEILCIDAGSDDGTLEILNEFAKEDDRVRVMMSDRRSYGHQVNMGIEAAKGEYIGIVETDDLIDQDMYLDLYEYASSHKADVVKEPYYDYYDERNRTICFNAELFSRFLEEGKAYSMKQNACFLAYHPSIWAGIYRREYLIGKDIRFIEAPGASYVDAAFRYDTSINTERNYWLNKAHYNYRAGNPNSSTNHFNFLTMLKRWNEVHKKLVSVQEDYDNCYGLFSITDEYDATLGHLGKRLLSQEEMELLIENYSFTKAETVRNSPIMPERLKENIIRFKENPYAYYESKHKFFHLKKAVIYCANFVFPKGTKRRSQIKKAISICRRERR